MRKIIYLSLLPIFAFAQIQINDNFSDSNFTANPSWYGDTAKFIVNDSLQLQLQGLAQTDTVYLSTFSAVAVEASWAFSFVYDQNISSSNYARVYLMSDVPHLALNAFINGYFLQIGRSSDKLQLYKQEGYNETLLLETNAGFLAGNQTHLRVQVQRDQNDMWTLLADTGLYIDPLQNIGNVIDASHHYSTHFGVLCRHTSTRNDKFFFDDFDISGLKTNDFTPPEVDTFHIKSTQSIQLIFNEALEKVSAENPQNYVVSKGVGSADSVQFTHPNKVLLFFDTPLQNQETYELYLSDIKDIIGNNMTDTLSFKLQDDVPYIVYVQPVDSLNIEILFSEKLNMTTVQNLHNYTIHSLGNPVAVEIDTLNGQWAFLSLSQVLQKGNTYTLSVEGIQDTFGSIAVDTMLFRFGESHTSIHFLDTTLSKWQGDTDRFIVNNQQLQLHDDEAGVSFLSLPNAVSEKAFWRFYLKMDFNPSAQNFARVYMMATHANVQSGLNAYFLELGSNDDGLRFYSQTGVDKKLIWEGGSQLFDKPQNEVWVELSKTDSIWQIKVDTSFNSMGFHTSFSDHTHQGSWYFGLECVYTSSRADAFYFDDIYMGGDVYKDPFPPEIDVVKAVSDSSVSVYFTKPFLKTSATDITHYEVNKNIGLPFQIKMDEDDPLHVQLYFLNKFIAREDYVLRVNGLQDLYGNTVDDSAYFRLYKAIEGDVVINELMVKPNPVVGNPPDALPEKEYIELYNQTDIDIDVENWLLQVGSSQIVLPSYMIKAKEYVILTKADAVISFQPNINVLGIDISATALSNAGTSVALYSPEGSLVSTVTYTDAWYADANKTNGGWSLEQVDPENICGGISNWRASISLLGGTPAAVNSVWAHLPDTVIPQLERLSLLGDTALRVYFTKRMDVKSIGDKQQYVIHPFVGIDSLYATSPSYQIVNLFFENSLEADSLYTLSFNEAMQDCSGKFLMGDSLPFALPKIPQKGDILINEILFNPKSGGADFIEVYNYSDKIFDFSKLRFGNVQEGEEQIIEAEIIKEESYLFMPHTYAVFTDNPAFIQLNYHVKNLKSMFRIDGDMPSMPDDKGSIAISTSNLQMIDFLRYTDDLHLPFIDDPEGVSLERLSFDAPTQDAFNWQSAAATAGFATPTYKNSQQKSNKSALQFEVKPKLFSPNQDGIDDQVSLLYNFNKPNYVISVSLWDTEGHKIKDVLQKQNVEMQGFVTWDGSDNSGVRQNSGIYIWVIEYFNADGETATVKETCVLSL